LSKDNGTITKPLPTATSTYPVNQNKIELLTPDGGSIFAEDFRKNPNVVPDPSNVGYYYISGQLGPGLPYPSYSIIFVEKNSGFIISLEEGPLKSMRLIAEEDFLEKVQLSKTDACRLNYEVMVPRSLNERLSGQNLGFSFCPGAVALPE
jgi:hypothetical protein